MGRVRTWAGGKVVRCDACNVAIGTVFIDALFCFPGGNPGWGNICPDCHEEIGCGLGTGKGQRYEWNPDRNLWVKAGG